MKKVYIVTGGNGFLGNNVVRKLSGQIYEIRVLLLAQDSMNSLKGVICKKYLGDITKIETLRDIFHQEAEEQLIVIHMAAIVTIENKPNLMVEKVNVKGTENVVKMCIETNARLIYVNSVHAIPEPTDNRRITEVSSFQFEDVKGIYAKSKAKAAQLVLDNVKKNKLNATIIQPSGIIGPRDFGMTHMTKLILSIAEEELPAIVKGGYDFVDVRDLSEGIVNAITKGGIGECYILSNQYITIREIADKVSAYYRCKKIKIVLPINIARLFAPLLELYYKLKGSVPLFTRYSLYTLNAKSNFSHEKADKDLGYTTRDIDETIKDTIDWFISMHKIKKR